MPESPVTLDVPVFSAFAVNDRAVRLSPLSDEHAVRFDGRISLTNMIPSGWTQVEGLENASFGALFDELTGDSRYSVQVKAVGDGVDYLSSDWSSSVEVSTLEALEGLFFQAETSLAPKKINRLANVCFRAKITDLSGQPIDPLLVSKIVMCAYKVTGNSLAKIREAIPAFSSAVVPLGSLRAAFDSDNLNFSFVPDQRVEKLFENEGLYEVDITLSGRTINPIALLYTVRVDQA